MKSYENLSYSEIEEMTLDELNQYIASYGKILQRRLNRVYVAKESREKKAAIKFILPTVKNIVTHTNLSGAPTAESEIKVFRTKKEAVARLKNLVENLRSVRSTVSGQRDIFRRQRKATRQYIKEVYTARKETPPKLTKAELDELADVFNDTGHGRWGDGYTSGEIIDAFNEVKSWKNSQGDLIDEVQNLLDFRSTLKEEDQ